jgi:hypothetical protein
MRRFSISTREVGSVFTAGWDTTTVNAVLDGHHERMLRRWLTLGHANGARSLIICLSGVADWRAVLGAVHRLELPTHFAFSHAAPLVLAR